MPLQIDGNCVQSDNVTFSTHTKSSAIDVVCQPKHIEERKVYERVFDKLSAMNNTQTTTTTKTHMPYVDVSERCSRVESKHDGRCAEQRNVRLSPHCRLFNALATNVDYGYRIGGQIADIDDLMKPFAYHGKRVAASIVATMLCTQNNDTLYARCRRRQRDTCTTSSAWCSCSHCTPISSRGKFVFNGKMRASVVNWMVSLTTTYEMGTDALYFAVNYVDRYMHRATQRVCGKARRTIALIACWVAAKYDNSNMLNIDDVVLLTGDEGVSTRKQILEIERTLLVSLDYRLTVVTPRCLLSRFIAVCMPVVRHYAYGKNEDDWVRVGANANARVSDVGDDGDYGDDDVDNGESKRASGVGDAKATTATAKKKRNLKRMAALLMFISEYVCEISLLYDEFVCYEPSYIAAASCCVALYACDLPMWSDMLTYYTRIWPDDPRLNDCVKRLYTRMCQETFRPASGRHASRAASAQQCDAIYLKYCLSPFMSQMRTMFSNLHIPTLYDFVKANNLATHDSLLRLRTLEKTTAVCTNSHGSLTWTHPRCAAHSGGEGGVDGVNASPLEHDDNNDDDDDDRRIEVHTHHHCTRCAESH